MNYSSFVMSVCGVVSWCLRILAKNAMIEVERKRMNYRFNAEKALETAASLLSRSGGGMNVVKLVKLLYLLDRLAIGRRGFPVAGGQYYSMNNGPMISEILDLINSDYYRAEDEEKWSEHITERHNHSVELRSSPGREHLSDKELDLIDQIWSEHGQKSEWELVDWCHDNCPEWSNVDSGSRQELPVESICEGLQKSQEQIAELKIEIEAQNRLDEIFAS